MHNQLSSASEKWLFKTIHFSFNVRIPVLVCLSYEQIKFLTGLYCGHLEKYQGYTTPDIDYKKAYPKQEPQL